MSSERWLYMSQRALITLRRGGIIVRVMLLISIPLVLARIHWRPTVVVSLITIEVLSCYFITSFSYFKVYQIIRIHQRQVQANETLQNFGWTAIDLAKYKKSVATTWYILLLFTFLFLPLVLSFIISLSSKSNLIAINRVCLVLLFSSSSLNPGLYSVLENEQHSLWSKTYFQVGEPIGNHIGMVLRMLTTLKVKVVSILNFTPLLQTCSVKIIRTWIRIAFVPK